MYFGFINNMRSWWFVIFFFSLPLWLQASSPEYLALADSADNYIKREQWEKAESVIIKALRLEPGNFSNSLLLSNLGIVRTNQGRNEEALESYKLGLSIAPGSSVLYNNRARTYLKISDYDKALADLDISLSIDSLQEWPLQMRGLLLINKGEFAKSEEDFNLLRIHYPENPTAYLGLAKIEAAKGNIKNALDHYNESIRLEDSPEIRFERILLKIEADKYSEASEDIRESIAKYPQHPDFYLLRGYLHRLNYRYEEARIDKKIALEKGIDPDFANYFIP